MNSITITRVENGFIVTPTRGTGPVRVYADVGSLQAEIPELVKYEEPSPQVPEIAEVVWPLGLRPYANSRPF